MFQPHYGKVNSANWGTSAANDCGRKIKEVRILPSPQFMAHFEPILSHKYVVIEPQLSIYN